MSAPFRLAMALTLAGCASSSSSPADDALRADPPQSTATAAASTRDADLARGEELVQASKFAEAIPPLKAALDRDPKSAAAAFYLGAATEQSGGSKKDVERLYRQALTFDPKLVEAAQNLAAIYLDEPPRPDEAIAVLDKSLSHNPNHPQLLTNLGYAYSLKGDLPRAVKSYEAALPNDDNAQLRLALGTALFDLKKPEAAVPHLLKAAAQMNDDAASLATIARMLGPGKAYDDCVRLLDRAIGLKGDVAEMFVRRGTCKHELKKEAEAGKDYEAAIRIDAKYQPAHYYLGLSRLAQGNKPDAKLALRKAWELGKTTSVGKAAKAKHDSIK